MVLQAITFTNIFIVNGEEIKFSDLTEKNKVDFANHLIRVPLETIGNIRIKNTA